MKKLIKTTVAALFLVSASLYAHDHSHGNGHHHAKELSQEKIEDIANDRVQHLVEDKVIDKSWADISKEKMEEKEFNHHFEWVVSYKNAKIEDEEKQTLYIFVSLTGKVMGANYTGK